MADLTRRTLDRDVSRVSLEEVALRYMREEYHPDEGGWVSAVDPQPSSMTLVQFRAALQRLQAKGLVSCQWWLADHDAYFGRRAVWFPERVEGYEPIETKEADRG